MSFDRMRSKRLRIIFIVSLIMLLALATIAVLPLLPDSSKLSVADSSRIRYGGLIAEAIAELGEQPAQIFRMSNGMVYIWEVRDGGLIRAECDNNGMVQTVMGGKRLTGFHGYLFRLRRKLGI
jgi:hypothetical protein